MSRFGFCSGTYQSQSPLADAELCMNLYPENIEGQGKSAIAMYQTPGKDIFVTLSDSPLRGQITANERTFAVAGSTLYEITLNGSVGASTELGKVAKDAFPASMAASDIEIMIASAGEPYVYNLNTNTFTDSAAIPNLTNVLQVGFSDGYFIAVIRNSNVFQTSALFDGTSWDPLDTNAISVFGGNINAMTVDHRGIAFFGFKQSVVYYDSGGDPPFIPIPGGFVEQGCIATFTPVQLDNTTFWLGGDARGAGIVWRAAGYTPQRVSNHAIEFAIQGYSRIDDAIGYSYQDQGHSFYVLYFPTPSKTWVYDVATGLWHERGYWETSLNAYTADRSCTHAFAFNRHLIGDWNSGNIYHSAINIYKDQIDSENYNLIRRIRRAPYVSNEAGWIFHKQMQVDLEVGLGTEPPFSGGTADPTAFVIEDTAGVFYYVEMNDNGTLYTIPQTETEVTDSVYLNDAANTTTWKMTVKTNGAIQMVPVTLDLMQPTSIDWVALGGTLRWQLSISALGVLQANALPDVPRGPIVTLRWSDDQAKTWSNGYDMDCGQMGEYTKRVLWRRLGRSRGRVYELSMSDPVPWRIIDAYLDAEPGYAPQDRLANQARKQGV